VPTLNVDNIRSKLTLLNTQVPTVVHILAIIIQHDEQHCLNDVTGSTAVNESEMSILRKHLTAPPSMRAS